MDAIIATGPGPNGDDIDSVEVCYNIMVVIGYYQPGWGDVPYAYCNSNKLSAGSTPVKVWTVILSRPR
jgi:hypothetical protein